MARTGKTGTSKTSTDEKLAGELKTLLPKEEAHSSVVGSSSAGLRRLCNASRIEAKKVPRDHSIYAATGTALHAVVERALAEDLGTKAILKRFSGMLFADLLSDPDEIEAYGSNKVDEKMIRDKVMQALDWFDKNVPLEAEVFLEKKVGFARRADSPFGKDFEIAGPNGEQAFGIGDLIYVDSKAGIAGATDWKFGENKVVDPVNSQKDRDQLLYLLAAAVHEGLLPELYEYEATIFQPAYKLEPDEWATTIRVKFSELEDFVYDLKDAIDSDIVYNPGDHCRDCKGNVTCPKFQEWLHQIEITSIEGMNNQELADALDFVDVVKGWIKNIEAAANRSAQDGVTIPGYTFGPGKGNHVYKDEQAAWGALGRLGLSASERTVKSTLSAPQALELLREKGTPQKVIDKFKRRHIHRPDTAEKLRKCKPGEPDGNALSRLATALKAR